MKQHRHISTIDLFSSSTIPTFGAISADATAAMFRIKKSWFSWLFLWIQAKFNIDGKQAIKSVPRESQINENA